MISVRHLHKSFVNADGSVTPVLKDVNCDIPDGEVISIIGPSGTGKSTFLRTLNMLETPDSGEILVDGENIMAKGYPLHLLRRKMGMVFQNFNLFDDLNVLDNITYSPRVLLKKSREEAEVEAIELLRKVGMAGKAGAMPDSLSGGQKQRVAIARALAMNPEVILVDEPTSALDQAMTGEVLSVLRQLAGEKRTMLIVTHELKFARDVSSRILFMNEGIIYEDGTPDQIFLSPVHSATKAFIQNIRKLLFVIDSSDFDYLDMHSKIAAFCSKYNAPAKPESIIWVSETMINGPLASCRPLTVRLNHLGIEDKVTLDFMIEGLDRSPLGDEDNAILDYIRKQCEDIVQEPTSRGFRIKVLF